MPHSLIKQINLVDSKSKTYSYVLFELLAVGLVLFFVVGSNLPSFDQPRQSGKNSSSDANTVASAPQPQESNSSDSNYSEPHVAEELKSIVLEQAAAWNRGDLEKFMIAYWRDNGLTFSAGGTTARGWDNTLARYQKNYRSKEQMGRLTFSNLETVLLSDQSALMLGEWKLEKENPTSGNFSLVWKKLPVGWKIIHDHSSALKSEDKNN